ncbi:UAA transporter family-domain-containing protein [Naematelia encephala]|uniref:UAA transporter family-domain-containing protein n=1 Tax=Naematelia encephala TaxID=71784 RepID=A0A1Y2BJ36_9TREE|nr:UAA transporter family-domain-containing protein [Naematelia encephala]
MTDRSLLKAFVESTAGEWVLILSLVFGGCCSNVWALEAILKDHPKSGTFLTFAQFVYVAAQNLSHQFYLPPRSTGNDKGWRLPRWRKNQVPIRRWMVQVLLFLGVSLMNNYAFGLKIPVTLHIIFRSGGLCISMLTGYLMAGKRYSIGQVFAGIIITTGIVVATLSAPRRRSPRPTTASVTATSSEEWLSESAQFVSGIALLSIALFMSAWLGLWQEQTYKKYGKQWREALFYSHVLSLPFFIPLHSDLSNTYRSLAASPGLTLFAIPQPSPMALFSLGEIGNSAGKTLLQWKHVVVPSALFAVALDVITQGVCIRGVNRLTSKVNSTTVNLILTLRKAMSLTISVWYYGSGFSVGLAVGGAMVLSELQNVPQNSSSCKAVGTIIYSAAPWPIDKDLIRKHEDAPSLGEKLSRGRSSAVEDSVPGTSQRHSTRSRKI